MNSSLVPNILTQFHVSSSFLFYCCNSALVQVSFFSLSFAPRLEQGAGPLPGSWSYHENQAEQNRKDQLSVSGGNKVTVVMSKSSDRLSPMMRETRSKFKKSQSIDEIDIGSYKVYRSVLLLSFLTIEASTHRHVNGFKSCLVPSPVYPWTATVHPSSNRLVWTVKTFPAPWSRPTCHGHSRPPC